MDSQCTKRKRVFIRQGRCPTESSQSLMVCPRARQEPSSASATTLSATGPEAHLALSQSQAGGNSPENSRAISLTPQPSLVLDGPQVLELFSDHSSSFVLCVSSYLRLLLPPAPGMERARLGGVAGEGIALHFKITFFVYLFMYPWELSRVLVCMWG